MKKIDIGGMSFFTGSLVNLVVNPLMWAMGILAAFLVGLFALYIRKRRKLKFQCVEVVDHGGGKFAINTLKCGFFGKKLYLRGLWWKGEEVLRTGSGEIIENFSTEDFQEINGRRGVVCFRDPVNQDILAPINKANITNKELLAEIADASYRDAAVDIFNHAIKETTPWTEKLAPIILFGGIIIVSFIIIVVTVQFVKAGQAEAKDLLLQAGTQGAEACRNICREAVNVVSGGAA